MYIEGAKFGDKFRTQDGRIAVVIGEHQTTRKHWYDFVALEEDADMINGFPCKFSAYASGIAFEGFTWFDIVEKI